MNVARFVLVLSMLMIATSSFSINNQIVGVLFSIISFIICFSKKTVKRYKNRSEIFNIIENHVEIQKKEESLYIDQYLINGFIIDKTNEEITFVKIEQDKNNISLKKYMFYDILNIELIVDEVVTIKNQPGSSIGGVIVGGILAGGIGAIIGASVNQKTTQVKNINEIKIRIAINDVHTPFIDMCLFKKTKSNISDSILKDIDTAYFKLKLVLVTSDTKKDSMQKKEIDNVKIYNESKDESGFIANNFVIFFVSIILCCFFYMTVINKGGSDNDINVQRQDGDGGVILPQEACYYLRELSFINPPSEYKPSTKYSDDYMCGTVYYEIMSKKGKNNNIAYYVSGELNSVNKMMVMVNINNSERGILNESMKLYRNAASELLKKAIKNKSIDSILSKINDDKEGEWIVNGWNVSSTKEIWSTGRGYEYRFTIQKISFPISNSDVPN
ncbi:hypothetical protein [Citrobacter sp. FP75]|uniref:hypothetical protein n=1 Tax=Citrobacter sp. FP75 TaxID=1852949 RepID=UPI001BC91EBF|nr:hypothetical protein [Citrobacter sp. FP75]